jgi:hypothetical protein
MEFLYHGSVIQDIKLVEPKKRFTPAGAIDYSAIYASPSPAFAICHSFPWSSDEGIDIETKDDRIRLLIPSQLRGRLNTPVSLYKIPAAGFEHTREEETGYTWHTTMTVPVLEEVCYASVLEALQKNGGEVSYI